MNQKGFANIVIILIVLVVVLAGALGYVTLVKKSAPVEQPQTNNSQNTQSTTPPATNNTVSKNPSQVNSGNILSGLVSISFPSDCSFSPDTSTGQQYRWTIDCGKITKADARGFMGKVLESQGWKFCDNGLATASWWKNGVITGIAEGPNSAYSNPPANSYPFYLFQGKGSECETPPPYKQ